MSCFHSHSFYGLPSPVHDCILFDAAIFSSNFVLNPGMIYVLRELRSHRIRHLINSFLLKLFPIADYKKMGGEVGWIGGIL